MAPFPGSITRLAYPDAVTLAPHDQRFNVRVPKTAELVAGHDAGFVCDAHDVEEFAASMQSLMPPSLRARQGAAAREAILPLSPQAMAQELVALYERLLQAG